MTYQIGKKILYSTTSPAMTNSAYQLSDCDLFLFDFFDDFFALSVALFFASLSAFHRANWVWCSRSISLSVTVNRMHCTRAV